MSVQCRKCVESVGFLFKAIKVGMSNMETHIQGVHVTLGLHIASPNISGTLNGGIRYTKKNAVWMLGLWIREVSSPPKKTVNKVQETPSILGNPHEILGDEQ